MQKDVLISVSSQQYVEQGQPDTLEMTASGQYYSKNGKQYCFYEELPEGTSRTVSNRIKWVDGCVEITKKGAVSAHMIFREGSATYCVYQTPFGALGMEIATRCVRIEEDTDQIRIALEYALSAEGAPLSDCVLTMRISEEALMK